MLLWQTFHNIPFNLKNCQLYRSYIFTTTSHDNIWIVSECNTEYDNLRVEIALFDTRTLEVKKLGYKVDMPPEYRLHGIASNHNNLYLLWRKYQEPNRLFDYKLYKLDTNTMTCTNILEFEKMRVQGKLRIIGNNMYCLNVKNDKDMISQIRIDLTENKTESTDLSEESNNRWCYDLLFKNGRKYILKHSFKYRKVFLITDKNDLEELCFDDYEEEDQGCMINTNWIDGRLIVQRYAQEFSDFALDTFDFESNEWNREIIAKVDKNPDCAMLPTAEVIDTNVYAVMKMFDKDGVRYIIGVLDTKPKLGEICLLQLVDELVKENDENKIDDVLEHIPITMRQKFMNTVKSRKEKSEKTMIERIFTSLRSYFE